MSSRAVAFLAVGLLILGAFVAIVSIATERLSALVGV